MFTASGKHTVEGVQKKISSIIERLGVPIQVFVSTGKSQYRKPGIGMWEFLQKEVSKNETVMVGSNINYFQCKYNMNVRMDTNLMFMIGSSYNTDILPTNYLV